MASHGNVLAVFIPPSGSQAAFLISPEQAGFPSSVPLDLPNSRSSCLSHPLGARESKGLFSYICLTPAAGERRARQAFVM